LEQLARDADEKKRRGESTGAPPTPTVPIKRRYDGPTSGIPRPPISSIESMEDISTIGQTLIMQHGSSPQPTISSRFPTLAQAGPVPPNAVQVNSNSGPNKRLSQTPQPQAAQQAQQNRASRGPQLGYFNADTSRPILQAASSQHQASPVPLSDSIRARSHMVAHEAQRERQQALLLEEQQQARKQQQLRMKQETDMQNLNQYEQYSTQAQQPTIAAHSRPEMETQSYPGADPRRAPQQQPFAARNVQITRQFSGDGRTPNVTPPQNTPPINPRPMMSAPPVPQELPMAARPPPPPAAAPARKSNIMSLLNDDPPEPRNPPPKRNNEPAPVVQRTHSPAQQQPLYQQPPRSAPTPQPPQIRREPSQGDLHGSKQQGYPRSTGSAQGPPMRVVESPYSAAVQSQAQQARPPVGSPMESAPPSDRDYYAHQQYMAQQQQQQQHQPVARSPPMGPAYHAPPPPQAQQPSHRQLAFGQSQHHTASPPTQYASQPSIHSSRHNSFDGRQGLPTSVSSLPPQPGYSTTQQQVPVSMPYQNQPHQHALQPSRFASHAPPPTTQVQSPMTQQLPPQHQQMTSQHGYSPLPAQHLQHHQQPTPPSRTYTPLSAQEPRYGYGAPPQQPPPHHTQGRSSMEDRERTISRELNAQRREYSDVPYDRRAEEQYMLRERDLREREAAERERERERRYEERRYEESRR
jgi:hypothetical protein